jgi:RimJ/RimL family protein N-acetyltransferase
MQQHLQTARLGLTNLRPDDASFILELLNTPGWLEFIGDRNVRTLTEAGAYVQKIIDNAAVRYWVVRRLVDQTPIGIISLIKRDDLEHPDIGFSFLPAYAGQGYAIEAASAVMDSLQKEPAYTRILAITIKGNRNSIRLLEKLGLRLEKEIDREGETLLLYATAIS